MNNSTAAPLVAEDQSPLGWFHTADHKRVGRLFVVCALAFGVAGVVVDLLVRLDLASATDSAVLGLDAFAQMFWLSREALVLLVVIPAFLGVATYVVPLQIGAPNVAFARGSAASFWAWLVSAGIYVGAYAGNGGPYGGWADGVDLYLVGLAGLVISLLVGAVSVATTVLTMRSAGVYLDMTAPFSWSALVTASMLVVSLPVLLAQIAIAYVDHRYGRVFLDGNYGISARFAWAFAAPQLFIYVVPVLGVAAEVLLAAARRWVFEPIALYFTIGLVGLFGFGTWANFAVTTEGADVADGIEGIVLVALYAGVALGTFGLMALIGFTFFGARKLPKPTVAVVAGALAVKLLLIEALFGIVGSGADLLQIADRGRDGNPFLRDTTWVTSQFSLVVYGVGVLGFIAALHWWAPKMWGIRLSEAAGWLATLLVGIGAALASLGPGLSGVFTEQPEFVFDSPQTTTTYLSLTDASGAEGFTMLGALGVIGVLAGLAVTLANLVFASGRLRRRGADVGRDPWNALTPEWLLPSPPPPGQPEEVAVLTSGTPLLVDEAAAEAAADDVPVDEPAEVDKAAADELADADKVAAAV